MSDVANPMSSLRETADLTITQVGRDRIDLVTAINEAVFDTDHVIRTFDRDDLLMLVAWIEGEPVGFKIGYKLHDGVFYSAKGGVVETARRRGIARALLHRMIEVARSWGYATLAYDTFPNKHPGMTVMGLDEGFEVVRAGWSPQYEDYRLRFELEL